MAAKAVGIYCRLLSHKCLLSSRGIYRAPRLHKLSFLKRSTTCSLFTSAHGAQAQKDYYKILGVSKDATNKDIRDAYVQLVKKTHPDKYATTDPFAPGEDFIGIQEAYEVLSDPSRRSEYDMKIGGYKKKNRVKERYKASAKSWNRPSAEVPTSGSFRPDSVLDDEDDKSKAEENRFVQAGNYMKFVYFVAAAVIITQIYFFWDAF